MLREKIQWMEEEELRMEKEKMWMMDENMWMEEKMWMVEKMRTEEENMQMIEEKECIIQDYEKKLQKQREGANMVQFDDNDEDEVFRMMVVISEKRCKLQEIRRERRWGMCGAEGTKYLDHTFDRKSLLDAHPKDSIYLTYIRGRSSQETGGDGQSGCDDQSCFYR